MKFISTKAPVETRNFQEVIFNSLAQNKSLFIPAAIPTLSSKFFDKLPELSIPDIGTEVLQPYVEGFLSKDSLNELLKEALNFQLPLKKLDENMYVLELFHGPTKAFKDVGARVMARLLSKLKSTEKITILAATSGDTGSAVANGFYNVPGIDVVVLFPKGRVSPYQEHQMTSLGNNIHALEIEGSFDDCQRLVKELFNDSEINSKLNLSSANSINLARLLPQMIYYFYAYAQLSKKSSRKQVYCVPSGNLGNLTAGLYAKKMGLPIYRFIAAENENDSFVRYLENLDYVAVKSQRTLSNAMDVGDPSNFERIEALYKEAPPNIRKEISAGKISDSETLSAIRTVYKKFDYMLDPHGAVGYAVLKQQLDDDEIGVLLETAHPFKFEDAMKSALSDFKIPQIDEYQNYKIEIEPELSAVKDYLINEIQV